MVEFCDKCEGLLLPSKINDKGVLKCINCGKIKPFDEELTEAYKLDVKIEQ
ncbi:MAG: hypothetical protein ACFE8A_01790 [Candidatus Hodarchaeota archaeon]